MTFRLLTRTRPKGARRAPNALGTLIVSLLVAGVGHNSLSAAQNAPPGDAGENQFGVSLTLFSTLAAINAAGYDAGLDSPLNQRFQLRQQVRDELAKRKIACLPELRDFYKSHLKPNATNNLSQYISFAMAVDGPPTFAPRITAPPDVEALSGFGPLLATFYKQADIEDLWKRSQQAYAAAIQEYQEPVINALFEANGYLRNPTTGDTGRQFRVYLDLLAAPDQVQVRSYDNDYFIVITPTSHPVIDEIRDAYLSYLLDPLTFKASVAIAQKKKALQAFADNAPALDLTYKDNFSLLVTKCLIKAIDSRIMHASADKKQEYIDQAMREGFILTAAFADALAQYEKQEIAMRIYYPDLIDAIDVKKEEKRLRKVDFVQSVAPKVIAPPATLQLPPAEQSLEAAEGLYEQKDFDGAEKSFKKVYEQTDNKVLQARATFGLARCAVQQRRMGQAIQLFERTIAANPDPTITAWSHIYLGRIRYLSGDLNKANEQFKLALAIDGTSAQARDAAERGVQTTSSSGDHGNDH
ncbi:MAG TPA: tetratricopeptide repeat protein [Bryobacteraceae bacterium]|nr:tetratricopeptide repeat protein [Bryobacteraceae bacterium]